jgi:DNA-binding YbaB/EbfC family protein
MFGKIGDMLGKLQEMKQKADEIKARLETMTTEVTGASGDIKVRINGNRKVQQLSIAPSLLHGNNTELEKQLITTLNDAIAQADKMTETEMKKLAGGLLPPGLL